MEKEEHREQGKKRAHTTNKEGPIREITMLTAVHERSCSVGEGESYER